MRWVRCVTSRSTKGRCKEGYCGEVEEDPARLRVNVLSDGAFGRMGSGIVTRRGLFERLQAFAKKLTCGLSLSLRATRERAGVLLSDSCGQTTVEAAVLLPTLMLLFALLLQPVCLSYTKAIMRGAAAECARAAATAYGGDVSDCTSFALRRLKAVPEVPLFHVGGQSDWDVRIQRSNTHVDVSIVGHARPLPLMGAVASLMSESDGTGVVLRVSLSEDTRASWVGGDYGTWQKMWG